MDDYLRRIYEGDVHLEEQMVPETEEYYEQRSQAQQLEKSFLNRLPPEMRNEFTKIIEARIKLAGIEVEEACLQGMREGAQIALAFFKSPDENSAAYKAAKEAAKQKALAVLRNKEE